jgi:hypothetical protein
VQRRLLGFVGSLLLISSTAFAQGAAPEAAPPAEATPAESGAAPAEDVALQTAVNAETAPPPAADVEPGSIKDRSEHTRPYGATAMLYLPWYYGIGIGVNARFEIPIVPDGFISAINDQISLEPSIALGYRSRSYGWAPDRLTFLDITPALYAMWSFHITPKFRPYGALGLGYDIGIWLNEDDFAGGNDVTAGYFYWDLAAGLFYEFNEHAAFRCELGAQGPKAGFSVFF